RTPRRLQGIRRARLPRPPPVRRGGGRMNTHAAIEKLLRDGHGNKAIAKRVRVRHQTVAAIRAELGIPNLVQPTKATYREDAFWQRTQPVDGGHLNWTGHYNSTGVPCLRTT